MNTPKTENIMLLGKWSKESLDHLLHESSVIKDTGQRMDFISQNFLGTVYRESTLIGDINTPEAFVINLEGMDCTTFIEYIEAMRLSDTFSAFMENLKKVRYHHGKVSFETRNHFFTDWIEANARLVEDVTERIGGSRTIRVKKKLNLKRDGIYFLPGIPVKDQEIQYIPADAIDDALLGKLKTGDYAGMYSQDDGLDVSHVGIIIKAKGTTLLRHASSHAGKVIDEDLKGYIAKRNGIVVLRPRN